MSNYTLTYTNRVRYTLSHEFYGTETIIEPKGWRSNDIEYSRHKRYHGLVVNFSNNLIFVENGAKFILEVDDLYGVNAEIYLKREERHPKTDNWTVTYTGVLDLSELKESKEGVKVKLNSSGLEAIIKSREGEKVEIEREKDLDGNSLGPLNLFKIEAPERDIYLHSEFQENKEPSIRTFVPGGNGKFYSISIPFPMKVSSKSDELIHNPVATSFEFKPDAGHLLYGHNDRFKKQLYNINGSVKINPVKVHRINGGAFLRIVLSVYSGGINYDLKENIVIYEDASPTSMFHRTASFNKKLNLSLEEGDSLVFRIWSGADLGNRYLGKGYFIHDWEEPKITLSIDEDSFYEKSSTNIVLAHELGSRLSEIITGKRDVFESKALGRKELGYLKDGVNSLKGYTCGHWIRGFKKELANEDNKYKAFTTSFKDYMEDLMVSENLGLAIEKVGFKEKIVVKPLEEFYVDAVTVRLPNQVNNLERSTFKEGYFSSVQIGCAKGWNNEEAMGLDEYNTQTRYLSPITRLKKPIKKITKYIYASYAFEFIRRKPKKKYPTVDHRNDKEVFALDLKRVNNTFAHRLWNDDFEEKPTGVYSPESAYNLRYTPLQMLLRHKNFLAPSIQKYLTKFIRFGSSEGNSNLTLKRNGVEYNEKQDIVCREFGNPKFLPKEITFEHVVDFDVWEQLNGTTVINGKNVKNIYGLIEFINDKGEKELGRFQKLKPNGKGKWTLLKAR